MIPPVVIGGAPPVTANPALVRFSAARWPTLPSPRTAIVVNPIDLPVRWPRKLRFALRRIRSATQPFQLLGRQILQLRKLGNAMGGTRSRVDRTPPAARFRLSGQHFRAPFPGAESVISRLSDSISSPLVVLSRVPLAPRPHPEEPAKRASRRASPRCSPTGARWVCHASPVGSLLPSPLSRRLLIRTSPSPTLFARPTRRLPVGTLRRPMVPRLLGLLD